MTLAAAHNADTWRSMEAFALNIPAAFGKQGMACRREACHVRHLRPSDYCKAGGRWQVKQLLQPTATYLFNHRFSGTAGMYRRILIPCRREPVRSKRGGHRPANDPAEEATARASQHAPGNIRDESLNYLNRVKPTVDEWAG